jgi:hypothetical protein
MSMIIDGTNGLTFNNATTQASAGQVLQVVQGSTNSGLVSTTSTSYVTTNLSASITPKFSTSKILILVTGPHYVTATNTAYLAIYRGASSIAQITQLSLTGGWCPSAGNYLDSPATTSATTYTVYFKTSGGTTYFGGDSPNVNTITLMEIAA